MLHSLYEIHYLHFLLNACTHLITQVGSYFGEKIIVYHVIEFSDMLLLTSLRSV